MLNTHQSNKNTTRVESKTLKVELGDRSYPIYIGQGLCNRSDLYARHIRSKRVMVVTNETIAPIYLDTIKSNLDSFEVAEVILPDGEAYKNLEVLNQIYTALLENKYGRDCTLIALGGGVVGDMTGFAAATYQRGVDFIQVPTTLLAQVDSSVGGKTGVNHPLGKNMIGAFYQPLAVIIDTDTLNTLEQRQLRSGLAEVIKYGLIMDIEFYDWIKRHLQELLELNPEHLIYAINRSCECKAEIVAADEKESGKRALLNLGHTFGHAIETGMGYGEWLHGEAVATGMCMAADLSAQLGWLPASDAADIRAMTKTAGLPVDPPTSLSPQDFLKLMAVDKKVLDGQLRLVLLHKIGEALVTNDFDQATLERNLQSYHEV